MRRSGGSSRSSTAWVHRVAESGLGLIPNYTVSAPYEDLRLAAK
jgi:hypothetical protein